MKKFPAKLLRHRLALTLRAIGDTSMPRALSHLWVQFRLLWPTFHFLLTRANQVVYFFISNSSMLSTTAEHALRALNEIAALGETESILGKDLARRAGIPANYLSKVLWVLGNAGIIDATRGSGGGYRLRRKAAEIRLIEVVELFDRQKPERRCLLGGEMECSDENPCGAHEKWRMVRATYVDFLEKTTIAEITHRRGGQLIPIEAAKG